MKNLYKILLIIDRVYVYEEYFNVTPVTHNQHGEEFTNPKLQTRVKPCGIEFIYDLYKKNIA